MDTVPRPIRVLALIPFLLLVAWFGVFVGRTLQGFWTGSGHPATRPQPNPQRPITLTYSDGGQFVMLVIGLDGDGCEKLMRSDRLYGACLLAFNANPAVIGGAAQGLLNAERTPSLDALIWRARADGDVSVCERGGLLDDFLAECQAQAVAVDYEIEDSGLRLRVPISPNGAE